MKINCLRSKRFVISIKSRLGHHKVFQIAFQQKDGSVFAHLPYFQASESIVSLVTVPANGYGPTDVSLCPGGKVTTHKVKYSHHPDGRVHFSQDGKVLSVVRKQSVPLDELSGHMFTVQLQGLSAFESIDPHKNSATPNEKQTTLTFELPGESVEAAKIVARYTPLNAISVRGKVPGNSIGPIVPLEQANGKRDLGFLLSTIAAHARAGYGIILTCESIRKLDSKVAALFMFFGGMDDRSIIHNHSVETRFLALNSPVQDAPNLLKQIGTIDLLEHGS